MSVRLNTADFKSKVFDFETEKEWKYLGDMPAIVDFYADWCGPCRMVSPILDEIAKEYEGKMYVYKVNTEVERELSQAFGIQSIPSLLFIPMDAEPRMAMGAMPKSHILKAMKEVLHIE